MTYSSLKKITCDSPGVSAGKGGGGLSRLQPQKLIAGPNGDVLTNVFSTVVAVLRQRDALC